MSTKLRWGILGTGFIAKQFAKGVARSQTGTLSAVGSRSQASADTFGDEFSIPRRHATYEALLADPEVDAIYISVPHPLHAEWAIKAADAGKHILCEKPIGINYWEAASIVEAARRNSVFLMEAFMVRCHPQTAKIAELVASKVIGEVRLIEAAFSFSCEFKPESRLLKNSLGGGGILDVGCYAASTARLIAGAALGKPFADPIEVKATGVVGSTNVDEYTIASLKFPGNILAQLTTGVQLDHENVLRIYGSEGRIVVPSPWIIPMRDGGESKILLYKKDAKEPEEVIVGCTEPLYSLECDSVGRNVDAKQSPHLTWDDTLGNMRTLDLWREQIGMVYDSEKPGAPALTIARKPLARAANHPMKYGKIAGVSKEMSRLVMGVDNQRNFAHAAAIFDDWFEKGGNTFDTAYVYGGGNSERLLGQWVKNRGVREQVVIIGKGAHTPLCSPAWMASQLKESLEKQQTEYVDIYMMHRDNLDVPIGEWVEALNEQVRAGRIRVFGGSNWSIERVEAANAYAASKGLQGFSVVSNNFSLARMVNAVWPGCIQASDPKSRAWFTKTQMNLMPWSSQARGFFTDRAAPEIRTDFELYNSWYSEDNFQRKARVNELAAKKNVLPINIALAYVLHQPFPTFPLIGPRTLEETRTSLPALDIVLTPQELKWLNLED